MYGKLMHSCDRFGFSVVAYKLHRTVPSRERPLKLWTFFRRASRKRHL